MAEYTGDNRKIGEDEPARLDQSKGKSSSEDLPARLNQDMIEAGSSTAEYAGTKRRRFEVEQATRNQDMIELEAESTYDVFLSSAVHCSRFTNMLYKRLTADGHRVLKDDGIVDNSEKFPLSVYNSEIYIPIFSKYYAGSARCLDALALMVEQTSRSGGKKQFLPVFHNEGWSDGKLEITSLYRDALDVQRQQQGTEKVERWKQALVEAGKIKRLKLNSNKSEGALITAIHAEILFRRMIEHNHVFEDLSTGYNPMLSYRTSELKHIRESKIMELLELEVNDVRIVGIHGRAGVGKTAFAKIVYDRISLHFDACSFLAEIEETRQQPGGVQYLQTKLIFDILKKEYVVASAFKGVGFLKGIFRNMKVLIVLDDVERASLLKEFVGAKLDWFGSGSRIIVTSKESRVLQGFVARGLAHTYDFNPMEYSFNFFRKYGPRESDKLRSYVKIAIEILRTTKGLPLLLNVFGSFLRGKGLEEWIDFEKSIQQFQGDYQKILSKIYGALDPKHKQMYLDIACFLPNVDCRIASFLWHWCDRPNDEIEVLRRMYLIKTEENEIGMHSMLRCLARKIIREGFSDPERTDVGSYVPAIAQETNKGKKGTVHVNSAEAGYDILLNTAFLSLGRANIGGQFADALSNVRWLHWQGCPRAAISIYLEKNENLVILDLSWSKVTESWGGWKRIKMERLKVLNLTGCADLLVTPSFSCCPKLEILILERCSRLVHIDPSINDLKLLVTLNLKFCTELSMLPVEMGGMNALKELLIDGTSVRELPESIGKLVLLQILSATNCFSLVRVLDSVCKLKALSVLALEDAKILELPDSFGGLLKLTRLSLRNCHELGKLPESIGELGSLVELDISGTGISKVLDSTIYLRNLKVLKMDSCFLREFPLKVPKIPKMDSRFSREFFRHTGRPKYLEEVHASWCRSLEGVIPDDIGELPRLRELRLRGTRISGLPSNLQSMSKLQTLDLLHCDILKELPTLPPPNLSNLYVNQDLRQKTLASSKFEGWWRLLQ